MRLADPSQNAERFAKKLIYLGIVERLKQLIILLQPLTGLRN
jgi:hypothetical protein